MLTEHLYMMTEIETMGYLNYDFKRWELNSPHFSQFLSFQKASF